jgi:hypothetical protein
MLFPEWRKQKTLKPRASGSPVSMKSLPRGLRLEADANRRDGEVGLHVGNS